MSKKIIKVQDISITIDNDYISITDMIKAKEGDFAISDWLRNRNTLEYISAWETMNNPDFNYGEFAIITKDAGLNGYKVSVKDLVEKANILCIKASAGRYGGTYAHKDIAFNFGMWISPVFQLYIVKEYQRLKEIESNQYNLEWDVRRLMTKVNYAIHTDAVQKHIIPKSTRTPDKQWIEYAEEADLLNVALFGYTAKEWRESNPTHALNGKNMRDFASITDLLIMSNLEVLSSQLMQSSLSKSQRFLYLKKVADEQRVQFDKLDMVKSIKKTNVDTYLAAEKLTSEELERESKKDILEANKKALQAYNKKK